MVKKEKSKKEVKDTIKSEVVRARITPNDKSILKKIAKQKKVYMSDIISEAIEKEIEKFEYTNNFQDEIDKRIKETDDKILKLKEKLKW